MATNAINSLSYGGNTYPFTLPYGVCSTAAATAAKVVTVDNFSLEAGAVVIVKFTYANSAANPTLNVNGKGAKAIVRYGSTAASTGTTTSGWTAGAVQLFVYDGTYWVRDYWYNTTYSLNGLGGVGTIITSATAPLNLSASKTDTSVTITGSITEPKSKAWWNGGVVTVRSDGVSEVGKYIDFHSVKDSEDDHNYRLTAGAGTLAGSGSFSTSTSITAGTSLHATGALTVGTTATIGSYITMSNSNPYVKFVDTAYSNATYYVQGYEGKLAFGPTFANAVQMDLNGNLTMKASSTLTPRTDNTGTIGTSAMKWNAMYATTFVGALSGNATTATTATQLSKNTRMDYGWDGLNYFNISGTAGTAVKANNTPTTAWWHILRFNHANNAGYYTDLAVPFNDTSLYYKRVANGALQNGGWIKVLDTLNYASTLDSRYFTESESNARFVYVSGDTMIGKLTMGASAQSGMTQAVGIHVHDLRSATITPNTFGDQSVNFIFDNRLGTSDWRSAIQIKGWTGEYTAWQLSGGASTAASNKLYYREGVKTSWGTWYSIPFENRENTFTQNNIFSGGLVSKSTTAIHHNGSRYGYLYFKNNAGTTVGYIYSDCGNATNITQHQWRFYSASANATNNTSTSGYYEYYYLPASTDGLTENKGYQIFTSKNYTTLDGRYVNVSGDTMTGELNMNNNTVSNIGQLTFADPGVNEGISWTGGNGWNIYESPDNLTNAAGNLQFVHGSTRRLTINKDGYVDINCRLVVRGNGSSYNEGIRILPASNGWSNVFFSADTTLSNTHDGGWLIGRRGAAGTVGAVGDFTIEEQSSNGSNLTIHKDSNGATLQGMMRSTVGYQVQRTAGNGYGLGLYGTSAHNSYGIHMSLTSSYSKHGFVQGDWATYFCFDGATDRGWIFKQAGTNVASISGQGHITGNYITGTWLQTTAATAVTTTSKIAALDANGWVYYITPANLVKFNAFSAGAAAGPKINLSVAGTTVTSAAIPTATASASGIVTTGSQTFAGLKTFNSGLLSKDILYLQDSSLVKGTAPSESTGTYISFVDSKGTAAKNRTGMLFSYVDSSNNTHNRLYSYKATADSTSNVSLDVVYPNSGSTYFTFGSYFTVYNAETTVTVNGRVDMGCLLLTNSGWTGYGTDDPNTAGLTKVTGRVYFKLI